MTELTDKLHTLPTETLRSLAALTGTLRAEQHLRALHTSTLKEMRWLAERTGNPDVHALVSAELDARHV